MKTFLIFCLATIGIISFASASSTTGVRRIGLKKSDPYYSHSYECKVVGIAPFNFNGLIYDTIAVGVARGSYFGQLGDLYYGQAIPSDLKSWEETAFFIGSSQPSYGRSGEMNLIATKSIVSRAFPTRQELARDEVKADFGAQAIRLKTSNVGVNAEVSCKRLD